MFTLRLAYPWRPKPTGPTGKDPRRRGLQRILGVFASFTFAAAAMTVTAPPAAAAFATIAISPIDVPFFSQNNSADPWYGDALGTCGSYTIHTAGCAVASLAMIEAFNGQVVSSPKGTGMDPGILNAYLKQSSVGGMSGCLLTWRGVPGSPTMTAPKFTPTTKATGVPDSVKQTIQAELIANRPVIGYIEWRNSAGAVTNTHFVVIVGQTAAGDYYMNDPADASRPSTLHLMFGTHAYPFAGIRTFHFAEKVVTVDETSRSFTKGGPAEYWSSTRSSGYGRNMIWTTRSGGVDVNFGQWTPYLPETALWEVYVWVPNANASANARYRVQRAPGLYSIVTVNQAQYGSVWISLGRFIFNAGTQGYVYLGDATSDGSALLVGYDAVKFVWRSAADPICTSYPCAV